MDDFSVASLYIEWWPIIVNLYLLFLSLFLLFLLARPLLSFFDFLDHIP